MKSYTTMAMRHLTMTATGGKYLQQEFPYAKPKQKVGRFTTQLNLLQDNIATKCMLLL